MNKSAVVTLIVFGLLPFSACNNGEQSAYMQSSSAEQNARDAEEAEQEYADLAAKADKVEKTGHATKKAPATKTAWTETKSDRKTETTEVKKATVKTAAKAAPKPGHSEQAEHAERLPASHVASKPAPAAAHSASAPHGSDLWVVQLGAFKVKENAEKLTARLKDGGFPVLMRSMNHSKNGELYIVHLEPTPNKTEAAKWQADLKHKSFDSSIVSRHD